MKSLAGTTTENQKKGFMVDTAEDGKEAVEKVKNSEKGYYRAVLMDIQMPQIDGYSDTVNNNMNKNRTEESFSLALFVIL